MSIMLSHLIQPATFITKKLKPIKNTQETRHIKHLNILKATYEEPTANITLNDERL